jgi:hypothetical protein
MARPRRAADDNPLVAVVMLVVLGGVAVVGIWNSLREKPSVAHNHGAATWEAQPAPGPGPSGPHPRFVEAFKRLPNDATALQRTFDAEFDNAARYLSADELAQVKKIISRNARSRDDFSDGELDTLRRRGFGNWVDAQAIRWSQEDPAFKTVSTAVWARSPRVRSDGELTGLAVKWGEKDRSSRLALLGLFQAVENKSRDLTAAERATLAAFAGEEYAANRH